MSDISVSSARKSEKSLASLIIGDLPDNLYNVVNSIRATGRVEVSQIFARLFLSTVREKHDPEVAEPLQRYFELLLDYFPQYQKNGRPSDDNLRARLDEKVRRKEALRQAADRLLDAFEGNEDAKERLSVWNAKTSRIVDLVAGTIAIENLLNESRKDVKRQYDEWKNAGYPENFRFDFSRMPLFNERLFFLPKTLKPPEDLYGDEETIWNFRRLEAFLNVTEQALYEIVLTPHPTNMTTVAASKIERDMFMAAKKLLGRAPKRSFKRNLEKLFDTFDQYAQVVHTPMSPDGSKIAKFTIRQEIEVGAFIFEQMFYNMRDARGTFDRTLSKVFSKDREKKTGVPAYEDDHRLLFQMLFKAGSWMSGDVDGHSGKKAEHFLLEEILLRGQIARLYLENIRELEKDGVTFNEPGFEQLKQRLEKIQKTMARLDQRLKEVETEKGDIVLSQSELDQMRAEIYAAPGLDGDDQTVRYADVLSQLETSLERAFRETKAVDQHARRKKIKTIFLLRNVRTFKAHTAHLEQRQTSDVHTRVMQYLLTDPALGAPEALTEDERKLATDEWEDMDKEDLKAARELWAQRLNDILINKREDFAARVHKFLGGIDKTDLPGKDSLRVYLKDDPRPITYHTLKRMQKALASEGAAENILIAETRSEANLLEALLLQEACAEPGNDHRLNIVPLFEEYDTLNSIADILMKAMEHKAYRDHLLKLAGGDPAKIMIEVMIAHSDNTKRAGNYASRASIHLAHGVADTLMDEENWNKIEKLFAQDGVDVSKLSLKIRNHEGKSASHANRAGVRAHTSAVDAFRSYYDTKGTLQGGDVLTVLMLVTNMQRHFAMHYSHVYKTIGHLQNTPHDAREDNALIEGAVARAFQRAYEDFSEIYYNDDNNLRGHLAMHPVSSIQANKEVTAGSREFSRGNGDEPIYDPANGTIPFGMTRMRAIADAENQHDIQAQAAWYASRNIERYLVEEFKSNPAALDLLQRRANERFGYSVRLFDEEKQGLTVEGAVILRKKSLIARELTDFVGYAAIYSQLEELHDRLQEARVKYDIPLSNEISQILDEFIKDNQAGIIFVLKSFGMQPPDISKETDPIYACALLRNALEEGPFNGLMAEVDLKSRLAILPMRGRDRILCANWRDDKKPLTESQKVQLRNYFIGGMVCSHGYTPGASDPALRDLAETVEEDERNNKIKQVREPLPRHPSKRHSGTARDWCRRRFTEQRQQVA